MTTLLLEQPLALPSSPNYEREKKFTPNLGNVMGKQKAKFYFERLALMSVI